MNKMLGFGIVMLGMLLVLPDRVQSQDKRKKSNIVNATPDDYKALARSKEVTGIIVSADFKSMTFRIEAPVMQAVAKPNKKQPGGARLTPGYKEFELSMAEKVVVKKMFVDAEYDDKGNFKVDEAAQKALRAKGYISITVNDIKSGNIAKLTLSPPTADAKQSGITTPVVKSISLLKQGVPVDASNVPEKKKKG